MSLVFEAYAKYYDLLYSDKDYDRESDYIAEHIRNQSPEANRILELGCGTGAHAEHLARMGYTVHGIDMSEAMLARAEARKATLPSDVAARLSFSLGDVRTVRTRQNYDVVISLFHVMSYQTSNTDLESAFETAFAHLQRGGLFLFDFWYGPAVLMQRPEVRVKRLEDADIRIIRIAEPSMHVNENVVDINYTIFIEVKATGSVSLVRETHHMRYLFLPELICYWRDLFQLRNSHAWMSNAPLNEYSWAGFQILARL